MPVRAGELSVRVTDASGRPVPDAVVVLRPVGATATPARAGGGYRVEQRNIAFNPFVSVVPQGATVSFPNLDPVRHHVYSFSPAKRFELKLFGRNEQRSVTFERAGVVAVGCNIHDTMLAYIYVTDSVWTAKSGANGAVRFSDTPARSYSLTVWHPYLRAPGNAVSMVLPASAASRNQDVPVRLRPPPMRSGGGY